LNKYLATYGKPRFLGIVELGEEIYEALPPEGLIVVSSHRGEEMAVIMGRLDEEQEREYRGMKTVTEHGEGPARGGEPVVNDLGFIRVPSDDDLARWRSSPASEKNILKDAQEMVEWHHLELKLIDAETMIDGKKLFFYFTSENRVDFRTLVKDMARKFRTRIELRQMGVRDEARIIKGLASCGLPCCCGYWLNQFAPIGIKMVKEQNIALNPAKISGICGRLMCCMSFEHKTYKELWAGLPGPGSKIKTPQGNYIVSAMDVGREALRCHKPSGGDILVPIALFADFKKTVLSGEEWELPESEREAELERAARKRSACACPGRFSFGAAAFPMKSEPGARKDRAAERAASGGAGGVSEEDDDGGKRPPRRRGRRGGRRHKPDAPDKTRGSAAAPGDFKPAEPDASAEETKSGGRAPDGARPSRPRRRRKRPKPEAPENYASDSE
jgi:cell fate regulator YaaT (PSP1 superfamily)